MSNGEDDSGDSANEQHCATASSPGILSSHSNTISGLTTFLACGIIYSWFTRMHVVGQSGKYLD